MAQPVKDLVSSLLWLWLLQWHGFDPWPGNFHMPGVQTKIKQNNFISYKEGLYTLINMVRNCIVSSLIFRVDGRIHFKIKVLFRPHFSSLPYFQKMALGLRVVCLRIQL